jgi:imidazolonepropionase-like amidohydrolase
MANNAADLVFRNGLIVTPGGTIEGGVAILDGKIAAVGSDGFLPTADRHIDLAGKYLLPGAIDPECHLGSHRPLADDFQTETRAAAATGVTTWGMQLVSSRLRAGQTRSKARRTFRRSPKPCRFTMRLRAVRRSISS